MSRLTYWHEGPRVTRRGVVMTEDDQRTHLGTFQANLAASIASSDDQMALAACSLAGQLISARIKARQWRQRHRSPNHG